MNSILRSLFSPSFPELPLLPLQTVLICVARLFSEGIFASRSIDSVMELQFNCDKKTDFFFFLRVIKIFTLQRIKFVHKITWFCLCPFFFLLRQYTCLSALLEVYTFAPLNYFQKEGHHCLFGNEKLPSNKWEVDIPQRPPVSSCVTLFPLACWDSYRFYLKHSLVEGALIRNQEDCWYSLLLSTSYLNWTCT